MRAIHTIIRTLALAAVLLPLASCVEKEVQLPALSQPGNINYEADFGSLSLTWAPVENAAQYYYKLENALGYTVTKGTTKETHVTIGSLQPATTYTVRIKAIPAGVDVNTYAASDFYVTEATTAAPKSYDFESGGIMTRTSIARRRARPPSAGTKPCRPMSSRPGAA